MEHLPISETSSSTPRPDPTERSQEMLYRELGLFKELLVAHLGGVSARFEAMDKAINLLQSFNDRQPTTAAVFQGVEALKELLNAVMAERKAADQERDRASAVAIDKSEASLTKQIEAVQGLLMTKTGSLAEKVGLVDTRVIAMESRANGATAQKTEARAETSNQGVIYGIIFGAVSLVIAIIIAFTRT